MLKNLPNHVRTRTFNCVKRAIFVFFDVDLSRRASEHPNFGGYQVKR
jgi:hypothetical protein